MTRPAAYNAGEAGGAGEAGTRLETLSSRTAVDGHGATARWARGDVVGERPKEEKMAKQVTLFTQSG
jgi:hypothetical protein